MRMGDIVMSLKGHDKGNLYVVIGVIDEFLLLCDGKNKTLSKPKKKNIKHLKEIGKCVDLSSHTPLYDAHIRKAIKSLNKCTEICL